MRIVEPAAEQPQAPDIGMVADLLGGQAREACPEDKILL
jgi:hypothetical protein